MPISQFDRTHMKEIIAGEGDWFTAHLLRLIAKADAKNRAWLGETFPDEVEAYEAWMMGPL